VQNITIPSGSSTRLEFYLLIPESSGNGTDFLKVNIDKNTLFSVLEENSLFSTGYKLVGIDLSEYADDGVHTLSFESTISGSPSLSNFFIDDVFANCSSSSSLPLVSTLAPSSITSAGATLNGSVNANNFSTEISFEFGNTSGYGSAIAAAPGTVTGSSTTPISATLTGLSAGTNYHYRIKGTSDSGIAYGADMTFITDCIPVVRIGDLNHDSIQEAIGAPGSNVIKVTSGSFSENLEFSGTGSVTLDGGYDCDLEEKAGFTTVSSIVIGEGDREVTLDRIAIL
jgi:hypothetical protein